MAISTRTWRACSETAPYSFLVYHCVSYPSCPLQINEALSDRQGQGPGESLDYALRQEQDTVGWQTLCVTACMSWQSWLIRTRLHT